MLKVKNDKDNYLGRYNNAEYEYIFGSDDDLFLIQKTYATVAKKLGSMTVKSEILERQESISIPRFLFFFIEEMVDALEDYMKNSSKEIIEENKKKVLDINLEELFKKLPEEFDASINRIRDSGHIVSQEFVNSFNDGLIFDSHPLDDSLKKSKFVKAFKRSMGQILYEYSLRFSLNYMISIAYVKYLKENDDKIILEYRTMPIPYEAALKLREEINGE